MEKKRFKVNLKRVILLICFCITSTASYSKKSLGPPNQKDFAERFPESLEAGYAWPQVISTGEKISFFIHSKDKESNLIIFKVIDTNLDSNKVLKKIKFNSIQTNTIDQCTPYGGCAWKSNLTLKIEENWSPGIYIAQFEGSDKKKKNIYFFVKNEKSGTDFLYLFDWTTLNAYNFYAGQNVYVRLEKKKLVRTSGFQARV